MEKIFLPIRLESRMTIKGTSALLRQGGKITGVAKFFRKVAVWLLWARVMAG
jgi:hypothetical protein